ncbi:hypothetical protein ABZW59_35825, partial [Nocardia aurea]
DDDRLIIEKSSRRVRSIFEVHKLSAAVSDLVRASHIGCGRSVPAPGSRSFRRNAGRSGQQRPQGPPGCPTLTTASIVGPRSATAVPR